MTNITSVSTEAPENLDTLDTLRDTLSAAVALGLPITAIAGTTAVEVVVHGYDYDDPDVSLGIYQNKESAVIALRNYVVERHDEMEDMAPWCDNIPSEVYDDAKKYDAAYEKARAEFLALSDEEIIASMLEEGLYRFTDHKIEATPTRIQ